MQGNSQTRYLELACRTYHDQLASVNPANDPYGVIPYLTSHGISYATAMQYRLGLALNPLQGDERFRGMLAFPYLTEAGVKSIKYRRLDQRKPKFAQPTGQRMRLYNTLAYFAAGDYIGLCEGEPDAIVATESLGIPSIGIPGAEGWQHSHKLWAPAFKDFQIVLMFADGDPMDAKTEKRPGEELAKDITRSLGYRVKVIECPENEDVCSMVATGRAEQLRSQAQKAIDGK